MTIWNGHFLFFHSPEGERILAYLIRRNRSYKNETLQTNIMRSNVNLVWEFPFFHTPKGERILATAPFRNYIQQKARNCRNRGTHHSKPGPRSFHSKPNPPPAIRKQPPAVSIRNQPRPPFESSPTPHSKPFREPIRNQGVGGPHSCGADAP